MLRIKPALILTGVILTILAAAAFSYTKLINANDVLKAELKAVEAQLVSQEAESAQLARDIEDVETINQQLLQERDRLAAIESRYQATTEQLLNELNTAQQAVNELRQSEHEDVKTWANTAVPASALRLLGNTRAPGGDAHSDDNHTYLFDAAGQSVSTVHRTQF